MPTIAERPSQRPGLADLDVADECPLEERPDGGVDLLLTDTEGSETREWVGTRLYCLSARRVPPSCRGPCRLSRRRGSSQPPEARARGSAARLPARAPGTPRSPSDRCRGWAASLAGSSSPLARARRPGGSVVRPPRAARPGGGARRA